MTFGRRGSGRVADDERGAVPAGADGLNRRTHRTERPTYRPASPDAARKALTALRVVVRTGERYGDEFDRDPCRGVTIPTKRRGKRRPIRILTPREATKILAAAAADDERMRRSFASPLVGVLFGTGLRIGEALALRWGADGAGPDARTITVSWSIDQELDEDGEFRGA